MGMVRCRKGHFYDDAKYAQCPYCGIDTDDDITVAIRQNTSGSEEDKTVAIRPSNSSEQNMPDAEEDDKTISIYKEVKGADLLVGWLVCVEGVERGRDFRLHQGFNRLGRNYALDIAVMEDHSISREAAFAVVYDDRGNRFYVVQQNGSEAYLNGTMIQGAIPLKTGDILSTGNSQFEFIAFCREGRVWTNK